MLHTFVSLFLRDFRAKFLGKEKKKEKRKISIWIFFILTVTKKKMTT